MRKTELAEAIIAILIDEIGEFDGYKITPETSLVLDLKIDSDDLSFLFIPRIEREMGVALSNTTWSKIHTVAEIADAFVAAILLNNYKNDAPP